MTSIGCVQQNRLAGAIRLPEGLTLQGVAKVWQAGFLTTLATFAVMLIGFAAARAAGVSVLSYDALATQVSSSAIIVLPFSLYSLLASARRGMKAVGIVGGVIALLYGALLAGVV